MADLTGGARLLHGAGDPGRLAILLRLARDGTLPACELAAWCDRSQPTLSHHHHVLRETGWVTVARCGSRRCCSLAPGALRSFTRIGAAIASGGRDEG